MQRAIFRRARRLHGAGAFKAVFKRGVCGRSGPFALYFLPAARDAGAFPRLGIVAGRACGTAALRNRAKRLVRETFRLVAPRLRPGDYVVRIYKKLDKDVKAHEAHALFRTRG